MKKKIILVKSHGAKTFTPYSINFYNQFRERPETVIITTETGKPLYINKVYQN